jgi:hypothetical protein
MPYPTLTFAEMLDNATRQELEQFISLLQGYLSAEHNEDGSHGAVTAESVESSGPISGTAISGTTGTFTGDVSVDGLTATGMVTHTGLLTVSAAHDVAVGSAGGGSEWTGVELAFEQNLRITSVVGLSPKVQSAIPPTLAGGSEGDTYRVFNASGSTVLVIHDSGTASAATYRFDCPDGVDLVVPDGGSFVMWYDTSSARWRPMLSGNGKLYSNGRTTADGAFTDVAYVAGDFTCNGGDTWTVAAGDVTTFHYMRNGDSITVNVALDSTSITSGTATQLSIKIPAGLTATKQVRTACVIYNNSTSAVETGEAIVTAGGTTININRPASAAFSVSANNTFIGLSFTFKAT